MIKGLIPRLPEMGKIKVGKKGTMITSAKGKKFRPPEKLDHFAITTTERDKEGDFLLDEKLIEALKTSGKAIIDDNNNLIGIPIRLLYNDIDLNFQTRYACYAGNKCVCSGDGEKATTRDGREISCPCKKSDFGYDGKNKCKVNGKLNCIIDGTETLGACHIFRTTSYNTVVSILSSLYFIQDRITGGLLAMLPFHLLLQPKTVVTPAGATTTVYIASIVHKGAAEGLRQKALVMSRENSQFLLEMENIETSAKISMAADKESIEEQKDVQEEFYPGAIDIEVDGVKTTKADIVPPETDTEPESEPEKKITVEKEVPKEDPEHQNEELPETKSAPPEEKKAAPPKLISINQKKKIVHLKKEAKIQAVEDWIALMKDFKVKTANDLTYKQATAFIKVLKTEVQKSEDPPPF